MKNDHFGLVVAYNTSEIKEFKTKIRNLINVDKRLKNDPMITYNHMQEDSQEKNVSKATNNFSIRNKVTLIFIAEEILIAMLLALIFYMI